MDVELSNPNTFVQSLLKLGSFLHGKTIEFLDDPTNYPPVTLAPWDTPTIPGKTTVEIDEHRKNTTFDQNYNSLHYRQSSAIDKIEYHFRDNTFHFIFNVSNGKSKLTIEVPRMALESIKLPNMK
ncbi:hypothetical protein, partial [Moraxella catarrhalis]|uniref:hypothetical protein n=1 Tax=Moraxella catarrhalis TaxID=480 RepID=UPI0022287899